MVVKNEGDEVVLHGMMVTSRFHGGPRQNHRRASGISASRAVNKTKLTIKNIIIWCQAQTMNKIQYVNNSKSARNRDLNVKYPMTNAKWWHPVYFRSMLAFI